MFQKLWRGGVLPPFIDPLFYLVGLGFGLGTYVAAVNGVPYREFVASGLCASAALWAASFETTYSFFFKMELLRTYDNMVTTPVEPEDVVLGSLLWAATRATFYGGAYLAVIGALGYVHSVAVVLLAPALFAAGFMFGAMGMTYSVLNRHVDYFGYYFTFVVTPMFLFGGIFFPFDELPAWAQGLAWLTPSFHLVQAARELNEGLAVTPLVLHTAWLTAGGLALSAVPTVLLRRRLIR